MIISEQQIMKLITIAHTHAANMHIICDQIACEDVKKLLQEINAQQSESLKVIE